jgi:hypothetical protein
MCSKCSCRRKDNKQMEMAGTDKVLTVIFVKIAQTKTIFVPFESIVVVGAKNF